ncbi:MAG: hypothetical protein C0619_00965 [Desulfuromonas sp.]|nr:MAG: hypothetical protein C0619_00965 [Desulfuromonas sp.]
MHKGILVVLMVLLLSPLQAAAFDVAQLQINGFLSQGYLDSSENSFLAGDSVDGTTEFNEVGIAVSTQISDKLRAGMQLLSRDLGNVGNNEVRLDWGFADYRHEDYLGVRIGKVKLPMGLYNEGRDTDMLRPMVFLPQSIYDETKRDLLVAYQGGGLYGNLSFGVLGDLDYHGFYGGINIGDESLLINALQQNASFTLTSANATGPLGFADQYKVNNVEVDNDYIAGGGLVLNSALDGLRLGVSWLTVQNQLSYSGMITESQMNPGMPPTPNTSPDIIGTIPPSVGQLNNEATYVASLEYVYENLTLVGEYSETERKQKFGNITAIDATSQSYYVMAAYTFMDRMTVSALYDVYYSDKDDKDGDAFAATSPSRQDFFSWRKDLGVGVRYDITPNWLVKAEYHDVDGAALFLTTVNDPAELEQDWDYFVVKTSVNF